MIHRMDSVVVSIQAALGARKLYGAQHAAVSRQLALALEALGELFEATGADAAAAAAPAPARPLRVVRLEQVLLFGDVELPSCARLNDVLVPMLVAHGVEWIEFHRGLTRGELTEFLVQLETPPSSVANVGTAHVQVGRLGRSSFNVPAGAPGGAGKGAPPLVTSFDRDDQVQQLKQIWSMLRGIASSGGASGAVGAGGGGGAGAGTITGLSRADSKLTDLVESIRLAVAVGADVCRQLADVKNHDEYTFVHTVNVAILSAALGEAVGMKPDAVFDLTMAALLHDVGKQRTPLEILNKPGKLDTNERRKMEQHTVDGAAILLARPGIPDVAPIVAFEHHANLDGTGYPSLIRNKRPHLASQIVHVADVFDALRTNRPYRAAMDPEKVRAILMESADKSFDKSLVNLFLDRVVKLAKLAPPSSSAPPKAA